MNMETEHKSIKLSFASIDKYLVDNIVDNKENDIRNKKYVSWGSQNNYPNYLYNLYCNVPTLSAIINGIVDYIAGDEIRSSLDEVNRRGENMSDLIRQMAFSMALTDGFALQVCRSKDGEKVTELFCLPMRYVRTDEHLQSFTYCEGFGERYTKKKEFLFPKYLKGKNQPNSVYYSKSAGTNVYPLPLYASAVSCCEIERLVNDYHLSAINNGFAGSYIVNFNNGVPTDEEKEQIEKDMDEKFAGSANAGRIVYVYNDNKENAITLEKMDIEDFGEKYNSLTKRVEQQIYTCFRATPNLFGVATESNGFNSEEYSSSFKLFNKTIIMPMQKRIIKALNDVLGEGAVEIVPFNINFQ